MASNPQKPGDGQVLRPSLTGSGPPTPGPGPPPTLGGMRLPLRRQCGVFGYGSPATTGDEPHGRLGQLKSPFSAAPVLGVSCSRWGWAPL